MTSLHPSERNEGAHQTLVEGWISQRGGALHASRVVQKKSQQKWSRRLLIESSVGQGWAKDWGEDHGRHPLVSFEEAGVASTFVVLGP